MAHVYYPDLLDELAQDLALMPRPYVLMVSVMDEQAEADARKHLSALPQLLALHVRMVPNRGRDIAPLLLSFREEILALDLLCHIHTKKSLYTGHEQSAWRRYLLDQLFGSRKRLEWILGTFQATPKLGLVYPENFPTVPLWAHTWLGNATAAREIAPLLGVNVDPQAYIDYPAGSMFWARVEALRPLYQLGLTLKSFPVEQGQADGTLQHAIERLLGQTILQQGMRLGILPTDGALQLKPEGERGRHTYFELGVGARINFAAIEAKLISFDLFDTLVLRPFLEPAGARAYLAHLVETHYGLQDFTELRERVEADEHARHGRDVSAEEIYGAMASRADIGGELATNLYALELATERRLLKPRHAVLAQAQGLIDKGKRLKGLSDMYLSSTELAQVLPPAVSSVLKEIYVSCQTGWRKDTGQAWREIPVREQILHSEWLHVGDSEHADVQLPQGLGLIHPVHVLRPGSHFSVIPGLRGLRPNHKVRQRWQDQLWLGLLANRFAQLGDEYPHDLAGTVRLAQPEMFGYVVLGPLLASYLPWLARHALEQEADALLFLAREGHLLQRGYTLLQAAVPALQRLPGIYLLASRRGIGTPAILHQKDLRPLLISPFTGSLGQLLDARLGEPARRAAQDRLGSAAMKEQVYLPEMTDRLIEHLQPAFDAIAAVATEERRGYLTYWQREVGKARLPIVADIGYAATIQAHLSRLCGQPLGGGYFAIDRRIEQVLPPDNWAEACFFDARTANKPTAPVMNYHLLLESLLTSPDGQFSHFQESHGELVPIFRRSEQSTQDSPWSLLEHIHAGAEQYLRDVFEVSGADSLALEIDRDLVQEPLRCVGSGQWQLGVWAKSLKVEDWFTGRGGIPPV
jgi:FMN phosphatase YigB (HAD superfamily)